MSDAKQKSKSVKSDAALAWMDAHSIDLPDEVAAEVREAMANTREYDEDGHGHPGHPGTEAHFTSAETSRGVHYRTWLPDEHGFEHVPVRGILFFLHGMNVHSGLCSPWVNVFLSQGIMVVAHDHASFGNSEGESSLRAHQTDFEVWTLDTLQLIELTLQRYKHLPFFVMGQSMGGLIAIDVSDCIQTQRCNVPDSVHARYCGSMLIAPALVPTHIPHPIVVKALVVIGSACSCLVLGLPIVPRPPTEISKWYSFHPSIIENGGYQRIRDDPLYYKGKMRLSMALSMMTHGKRIVAATKGMDFPFLIQHGGMDKIIKPQGSMGFFDGSSTHSEHKHHITYPDMFHPLTNDPNALESFCDQLKYINHRLELYNKARFEKKQPRGKLRSAKKKRSSNKKSH
jgi:alpha-beta hydrolase superfamily lysophospholipase